MAISFPASPVEDQVHNHAPGVSFVHRSGTWTAAPIRTALPKNYFVNPAFQISQQYGTDEYSQGYGYAAGIGALVYVADVWCADWMWSDLNVGTSLLSAAQSASPYYFGNYGMRVTKGISYAP